MSGSTSDFSEWLADNEPDGHEDIYALWQSVTSRESFGFYDVKTDGDRTFVKGPISTLALLSEKARAAFVVEVEKLTGDPEMDMESWYGYSCAMTKDD